MIKYSDEQIASLKLLVNNIVINGNENCKRIVMINQILEAGETEKSE